MPVGLVAGRRDDHDEVGDRALADEALGPGDQVLVAVAHGARADRRGVGAGLGLGDGERDQLPPGGEVGDPALLLLVGPGDEERQGAQALDREDEAGRRAGAADLLDREAGGEEVAAEAAEPLGEVDGEDVVGREELLDVPRELGRPVDLGGARGDLLVGEVADGVAQEALLLGEHDHGGGSSVARWRCGRGRRGRDSGSAQIATGSRYSPKTSRRTAHCSPSVA